MVLGTSVRNLAAATVLVVAWVVPGPAGADASGQPPQDVRVTPTGSSKLHVSWSDPAKKAGSMTEYRYKIQWKSGSQEYRPSREVISTGTDELIMIRIELQDDPHPVLRYDLFHRLEGLREGVEYTIRVIRMSEDGESEPSEEVTATPITSEDILRMTVEGIVVNYGEDSPWIQQTWQYLQQNDLPLHIEEIDSIHAGEYSDWCDFDSVAGLHLCSTESLGIDNPTSEDLIVHELAHVYSLDVKVLRGHPERAAGVAIALIYLGSLIEDPNNACNRAEFLADLMAFRELGDKADIWYWPYCGYPTIPDEALEIVGGALDGERPAWFTDEFAASGTLDLEKLWTAIQQFTPRTPKYHHKAQKVVVYHLRNSFGGYCNAANATASMFDDGPTRNPWRDGGCVPTAPAIEVASGNDSHIEVSWTAPNDDGGSPVEGYKVQWRSDGQQYGGTSQVVISDPSTLDHRLRVRVPDALYQFRVLAYNTNGDGTPSNEVMATTLHLTDSATGKPSIEGSGRPFTPATPGHGHHPRSPDLRVE